MIQQLKKAYELTSLGVKTTAAGLAGCTPANFLKTTSASTIAYRIECLKDAQDMHVIDATDRLEQIKVIDHECY